MAWASSKEARAHETSRVLKWVIAEFLYFDDWDVAIDILESRRQRGIISSNEFIEKYNTIRNMEQSRIIGIRNRLSSIERWREDLENFVEDEFFIRPLSPPEPLIGWRTLDEISIFRELEFLMQARIISEDEFQEIVDKINFREIYIIRNGQVINFHFLR